MIIGICGSREIARLISEWLLVNYVDLKFYFVSTKDRTDPLTAFLMEKNIPSLTINELVDKKPDLIFSLNYWKIIPKDIIDQVPLGIINLHHSYKLRFKGRFSTSWAIMKARADNNWVHGTTLHYIDEFLDEGEIVATHKCEIEELETASSLFEKVERLALQMFKDNFDQVIRGKVVSGIERDMNGYHFGKDSLNEIFEKNNYSLQDLYDIARAWYFPGKQMPAFNVNGINIGLKFNANKD